MTAAIEPTITQQLAAIEDPTYKSRSTRVKFMQQLFLGLGGATVFGLVGAIAISGAAFTLTVAAMGAIGIGCLYLGSKFLADSVQMDQENQARKIGLMSQISTTPTQEIQTAQAKSTPPGMGVAADVATDSAALDVVLDTPAQGDTPQTKVMGDKILDGMERLRNARNEPKDTGINWQDKVSNDTTGTEKARA